MSDIVSGVLKLTFGFLANKIRKQVVERLKDGDVTVEECRRLIVSELDDIRSKLDGLARQYLMSSVYFLQEGVNRLHESQLQFPSEEITVESTEQATLVETSSSSDTGPNSASSIDEAVALINATTLLKIHSNKRYKSAIKSFELAREKATEAFSNEALSIENRIQASQIRMLARILENLEDPDASVSDCLQYLKQLHDIGAIREIFSVLIDGGMKSRFNRVKRLNIASSVQDMNQRLFDFARKFTKSMLASIFRWPMILLGQRTYKPVFGEEGLVEKLRKSGVQVMSPYPDFTFANEIFPPLTVLNSKREIVSVILFDSAIRIFKRSGESRTICEIPIEEHASDSHVAAMDIDAEDNIYVITAFRESYVHGEMRPRCNHAKCLSLYYARPVQGTNQRWGFKLFILDETGNKKLKAALSFHQSSFSPTVRIALHKDGRASVVNYQEKNLYIGRVCVERNSYEIEKTFFLDEFRIDVAACNKLQFSNLKETKIIVNGERSVYIYTENGQLQRKIEIPDEHGYVESVVINQVTKRILVKTYRRGGCSSLLSFTEYGELIYSLLLESCKWIQLAKLISHPNGALALVGEERGILLQRG